ncbi:MAG: SDR family NAD(P)-dependent oxidoreductase [Paucibacter sp.]|nr:SDR family NAD(P)-dependent oxidoreductase [Roseateles sp.]
MTTTTELAPAWPPSLRDRTVVITGGFGALGTALGEALLNAGARVALIDKTSARPAGSLHGAMFLGSVDLCDAESTQRALRAAVEHFGRLDALVNVAGGFRWEPVATGCVATWQHLFDVNLRTALIASQAILPHMLERRSGRVVNIGSLGAVQAERGMGAYAASKAAVARLTEALAAEVKEHGITVNAILPSVIDTPANRKAMPDAESQHWLAPVALAHVVMFLLSDAAAAVNGALIPVKGSA